MAYSTLADVFSTARFRTGLSTSDFADNNTALLSMANKHYRKIVMELIGNNEDWYATITSVNLTDGGSPYQLSSDSSLSGGGNIKVLRVEVTYDGSNWAVATPVQYSQIATPTITETDVDNNFSTSEPYYSIFNNNIYLLPDADASVSAGMRIFEVTRRKELTASTNVFADRDGTGDYQLPKEFMEMMEDYLVADFYERLGKFQEATQTRMATDARLKDLAKKFSHRDENFDMNMSTDYTDYGE